MTNTVIFHFNDDNGNQFSIEVPMSEPVFNEDGSITGTVRLPSKTTLISLFEAQGLKLDDDGKPIIWGRIGEEDDTI